MKKFLSLVLLMCMLKEAIAQQQPTCNPFPKTITVSGTSEIEIVPDEIYVQVDLREYKKRGEEKVELEKIKDDFLSYCKLTGLPDSVISIASYEGLSNGNWWRKRKKDPELFATISYQIKFSSSKNMDDLISRLDDEATVNFRIVRIWHSKMSEYRKQLKIAAVKAAKEKALYLTEAINEKIGQAITIEEPGEQSLYRVANQTSNTTLNYSFNTGKMASDKDPDPVEFKKIKLQFQVNVIYALQ